MSVSSYDVPPAARQDSTQLIDTLDARNTQAVLAKNPDRGGKISFWTQHTILAGAVSGVRWYEIDPVGAEVRKSDIVRASGNFIYNGAISSDRQVDGSDEAFGDSFVIGYTESSDINAINPRIGIVSSVGGGPVSSRVVVKSAGGPYIDFFCPNPGDVCRWGDYSAANPDPRPASTRRGNVWLTNQFSSGGTSTAQSNWRTEIWSARP